MAWSSAGLVGAGPWAELAVVPALAASPGTRLAKVWARRHDRAEELARPLGAEVVDTAEEAMDGVDAIAFCVPPDVQAALLPAALATGAALLLEKPVARTVAQAEVLHDARVPVRVHYARLLDVHLSAWLDDAAARGWDHAEVVLTNGATLGDDPFGRSPWRREQLGALWDLGPHALAWLHVVLGPSTSVTASLDGSDVVLETVHDAGVRARSVVSVASSPPRESFVLHARGGKEHPAPVHRQSGADTYAALLESEVVDTSSPSWRAVADPFFSTALVATLAEAAAQLEGCVLPASHRSASAYPSTPRPATTPVATGET